MQTPEECCKIALETLEMMNKFRRNLPGNLHFPPRLKPPNINAKTLRDDPVKPKAQLFIPRTERDNDPTLPHSHLTFQFMDFESNSEKSDKKGVRVHVDTHNLIRRAESTYIEDDEDWLSLSHRADLMKKPIAKASAPPPDPRDASYFVRQDRETLRQLREKFGLKYYPETRYQLSGKNPLFFDP
ncbi:hypothetical protein TRFO_40433 [Tritrichomonas foetus]|uniref:Uncharacterized protein n=1 Tax=Tritrichomonas foetus TaxID=1144522 RepID=A0A1J4J6G2_9EUKA|nr:hypothetical protein TRFO_40433 [Tritrichomonas foetus]|eukprot:OHS93259.1 hypothetical protein TRFO_40433 [Tritrichomonas foetus]